MYKLSDDAIKGLETLQNEILENYGTVDKEKAINWFADEMSEFQEGYSKNDIENMKMELSQIFIWCISLSNILGFDLAEIAQKEFDYHLTKYPPQK